MRTFAQEFEGGFGLRCLCERISVCEDVVYGTSVGGEEGWNLKRKGTLVKLTAGEAGAYAEQGVVSISLAIGGHPLIPCDGRTPLKDLLDVSK